VIVSTSQNEPRYRMRVWSGVPPRPAVPAAGGDIDMVIPNEGLPESASGRLAVPGAIVQVEAGAAFAADADLETDDTGRAVAHAAGVAVLRSLEAAGAAGSIVLAVVKSGR
jgi:hypothetical protein